MNLNEGALLQLSRSSADSDRFGSSVPSAPPPARVALTCRDGALRCVVAESRGIRPMMEDAYMCVVHGDWGVFGVFDGHAGSTCANWVARAMADEVARAAGPYDADSLRQLVLSTDEAFIASATHASGAILDHSGSTGTVAQVWAEGGGWRVLTANVGDSRIVAGDAERAELLTRDHKPSDDEEKMRIRGAGGWVAGGRVDGVLAVSRAFGNLFYKQNENRELNKVVSEPTVKEAAAMHDGSFLLLCCDGVFEPGITAQDAVETVRRNRERGDGPAACAVVDDALLQGSQDNITCMLVSLTAPADAARAPVYVAVGPGEARPPSRADADRSAEEARAAEAGPASAEAGPAAMPAAKAGRFSRSEFFRYTQDRLAEDGCGDDGPAQHVDPLRESAPVIPYSAPLHPSAEPDDASRLGSTLPAEAVAAAVAAELRAPGSRDSRRQRDYDLALVFCGGDKAAVLTGGIGMDASGSCRVRQVERGSPAWRAGVRAGMDVVRVNGTACDRAESFRRVMAQRATAAAVVTVRCPASQWARVQQMNPCADAAKQKPLADAEFAQAVRNAKRKKRANPPGPVPGLALLTLRPRDLTPASLSLSFPRSARTTRSLRTNSHVPEELRLSGAAPARSPRPGPPSPRRPHSGPVLRGKSAPPRAEAPTRASSALAPGVRSPLPHRPQRR